MLAVELTGRKNWFCPRLWQRRLFPFSWGCAAVAAAPLCSAPAGLAPLFSDAWVFCCVWRGSTVLGWVARPAAEQLQVTAVQVLGPWAEGLGDSGCFLAVGVRCVSAFSSQAPRFVFLPRGG